MLNILITLMISIVPFNVLSVPDTLSEVTQHAFITEEPVKLLWDCDSCASLHGKEREIYNRGRMSDFPLAVRMNLFLPLLNFGIEIPTGKHSSFEADWYYPWFPVPPSNRYCFQALALNAGYRYWFSTLASALGSTAKTGLIGHSLGVSAIGTLYDFQWNGDGFQGNAVGIGLDYTYAYCIARGRLRLELSLGGGVVYVEDRPYRVYCDGGALLREGNLPVRHGFVPVPLRCGVSIVVPIGRDGAYK